MGCAVTYYRVVYKPAGMRERSFIMFELREEQHGRHTWLCGVDVASEEPLYLLTTDLLKVKCVP